MENLVTWYNSRLLSVPFAEKTMLNLSIYCVNKNSEFDVSGLDSPIHTNTLL